MNSSIEQITKYNNYNKICETFLSLAKDELMRAKLKEVLYEGKSGNYSFKSKFHCRDNSIIERTRRIAMASLIIRNPETFAYLEQNNINIFHGTNANALPNILKYGMNSQKNLEEKDIPVLTGEAWSRTYVKRNFISFTDVLDIAQYYSQSSSPDGQEDLSFGIVIDVSETEMNKAPVIPVKSDISEIGVMEHFPLESISCVCVPEDKVEFVKKMLKRYQIPVLGMDDLSKKAYYVDEFGITYLYEELYKLKPKSGPKFSFDEVKEIAESRSFFKMKEFIEKIKNVFVKEGEEKIGRGFR